MNECRQLRLVSSITLVMLFCGLSGVTLEPLSAGSANSLMDISADGSLLACSNRDSGSVTIVELKGHTRLREIPVGAKPEGVSFVGDSHHLAVAVYGDDQIVLIDADTGQRLGAVPVFDEPYGVVSDAGGQRLYATLTYPGQVLELDPSSLSMRRSLPVGRFLRGIALAPDQQRLYVTEFYTSRVLAIDLPSGEVVDQWSASSTDNLARQIIIHPHRPKAYLSHIRSRITAVHGAGSIFPYVSVIDTEAGDGKRRKRFPMDSFLANLVTANPWEVTLSPDGERLYVVFSGTDDMFACKVLDDNYREIELERRIEVGSNPRAVRVAPDGKTVYVYNALDFDIMAFETESLALQARIAVTANLLGDEILRGKKLFYSALQPMVRQRWISCSSCHPDGDSDGRTWHNPEGLRDTPSLAGMAWTHPLHWSADRDEVQDFEHTIRGPLMQGRGLLAGAVQDALGPPNAGLSADLDALATYSNSHKFTLSPHAKAGLSEAAQRGRAVFFSAETGCANCHPPPFYTDSRPAATEAIVRHDVGTGEQDPSEKMGPHYDTPTLLGIYRTAPYLHHGQAETLLDVLTTRNRQDRHGKTSHLSDGETADLIEFLRSLPYEYPEPDATEAGLTRIDK